MRSFSSRYNSAQVLLFGTVSFLSAEDIHSLHLWYLAPDNGLLFALESVDFCEYIVALVRERNPFLVSSLLHGRSDTRRRPSIALGFYSSRSASFTLSRLILSRGIFLRSTAFVDSEHHFVISIDVFPCWNTRSMTSLARMTMKCQHVADHCAQTCTSTHVVLLHKVGEEKVLYSTSIHCRKHHFLYYTTYRQFHVHFFLLPFRLFLHVLLFVIIWSQAQGTPSSTPGWDHWNESGYPKTFR